MAHRDCNRLGIIGFYRAPDMAWLQRFWPVSSVWIWISCDFLRIFLGRDRRHEIKALQVRSSGVRGHLFADYSDFVDSISDWKSGSELISGRRRY